MSGNSSKQVTVRLTETQYDALTLAAEELSTRMTATRGLPREEMNWRLGIKRSIDQAALILGSAWWNLEPDLFPDCSCAHHKEDDPECRHTHTDRSRYAR